MNGIDVLLAALVIAFSFVCWLCFQDFDRWAHYEDPFSRTTREIRELPETPYDWQREDAA